MAAARNGDGAEVKHGYSSGRPNSSSPGRSSPIPPRSRSHSPHNRRFGRAQEERGLVRGRSRHIDGRNRDRDRDTRDRDIYRERENDGDRVRDRHISREEERPRDRRSREWEQERSRDRRGSGRPVDSSPVRSPKDVQPRWQRSPAGPSRGHQRGSKYDQQNNSRYPEAARDEKDTTRGKGSPQQEDAVARKKEIEAALDEKETKKEKPSFEYSAKLAAETNRVKGVTLQFTEPPETRMPTTRWRVYVFKDGEPLKDVLHVHRRTCFLFGRDRRVADIPTDHTSCSKQHSVIQYK